ncbi:MAG: hypothetical protein IJI78_02130 [Oscillospiraceae bacterium]|nr:hypothetical protein [Oscillospiraceae bacterium]
MLVVLEGLMMAFWLLLICVVGIADGPVGLVVFYEQDVKDRVVELGLTTPEMIKKATLISSLAIFIPMITVVPVLVCCFNGAKGFMEVFLQMTCIYLISGLFDRLFIDEFWVGHTKAWEIPGTEDLKPYIPKETRIKKWVGTIVGMPLLAAIIAGLVQLIK